MRPPSMAKSAPVMFPATSLARKRDQVGHLLGPGEAAGDGFREPRRRRRRTGPSPAGRPRWRRPRRSPSHRSVATGPGLTVLTRMPRGPSSLDSDLQKLRSAALAAL